MQRRRGRAAGAKNLEHGGVGYRFMVWVYYIDSCESLKPTFFHFGGKFYCPFANIGEFLAIGAHAQRGLR